MKILDNYQKQTAIDAWKKNKGITLVISNLKSCILDDFDEDLKLLTKKQGNVIYKAR